MNKRLGLFLLLILLFGLTLGCSVCGLTGGEVEDAPAPAEEIEEVEEPEEEEDTEDVDEPEEEEDISISSVTNGLDSLDSYRSHMTMIFESGAGSSEGDQWTMEMDIEYVREPFAQRIVIQGGGIAGVGEGGMESVQIGNQQYAVFGDQCISTSTDTSEAMDMEIFELDDIMGGLDNARRVLPDETVNGILCRHYEFDETAVGWATLTHAEGEAWIAVDGDYVAKYTMVAEGTDPSSQQDGHVEWEYELLAVNTSITIEPPAGCDNAESEFPIMPDAVNTSTFGGMVTYESSSSFDNVQTFYEEQMSAEGWSETGDSFITSGTAMLNYTKDDQNASVTITDNDGTISVIIMSE
ncbi:MAG: hypothetical protein GY832_12975 [Chloroflexi bacterium]|nr:hypothetical protein [Chloroflexota bacterium]